MTTKEDRSAALLAALDRAREVVRLWDEIDVTIEDVADVDRLETAVKDLAAALDILDRPGDAP